MTDDEFSQRILEMTQTLYRVCYAQLPQPCDREDAVQETLRKVWQKRGQLRNEQLLQTWVIRVLLNECHNLQRRGARVRPEETLPERVADPMRGSRMREALLELPEKLRMPIVLHYMEGYAVEEIAAMLRVPQGTVKSRMRKGRQELKELLRPVQGGICRETIG